MTQPSRAPLYTDTVALCAWLVERLGDDDRALARAIVSRALTLLDAITLALQGRRREAHIDAADEELVALRVQLRLAAAAGYLSESQAIHALDRANTIGRQLGGWIRSLGAV